MLVSFIWLDGWRGLMLFVCVVMEMGETYLDDSDGHFGGGGGACVLCM